MGGLGFVGFVVVRMRVMLLLVWSLFVFFDY